MTTKELILKYSKSSFVQSTCEWLKEKKTCIQIKNLKGSFDALYAASVYKVKPNNQLFILSDKEEAAYFQNDIQELVDQEVLFYPSSYKKPYQFEEVENANILQRAEVLNKLNQKERKGEIVVTFPSALTEKVINKRSLVKNTFGARVGDSLDTSFISELLIDYGFEKSDFVYEAGQFSQRGGIIDIFSYSNDLPYRIELFGNEIESIRTFDPDTQLSKEDKKSISIIPDVQTKLLDEKRESFLDYISPGTIIWIKDVEHAVDVISKYFEKVQVEFDTIKANSNDTTIVNSPSQLFINDNDFMKNLSDYNLIEFGTRFHFTTTKQLEFNIKVQPSFNKNIGLLTDDLNDYYDKGYKICFASDSEKQLNRLATIFEETNASLEFDTINIGLRSGFIDPDQHLLCYTEHQIFEKYFKYKSKEKHSKSKQLTLKELKSLQPGDYVTHIDHGIGRFAGLHKVDNGGVMQEAVRIIYKEDDLLYVSIHSLHKIAKYSGKEGTPPSLSKLGSPEWENKKKKVKKKLKEIAIDLISLYAKRKAAKGFAFSPDNYMQVELESSFIYEDTPDQAKATTFVKEDMESDSPMDRLICGDVGFGKTEIAIRAAFKAVCDSKQVAVLVPTTVLAMQHDKTFKERLKNLPCNVDFINRFKSTKEIKEVIKKTKAGEIDILIGTHKIVGKDIDFKNLGLLIIDEEQKFGVAVKEKLKEFRHHIDVLTLTATPIPRTLQFSLLGARDLSIIATPPANRQPVATEIQVFGEEKIRDAISYEIKRGGQVFFVHNRVNDIEEVANIIMRLVPDARVGVGHGQMEGSKLEKIMLKFIEGDYDVLVSTNIIEAGLDIPNANTIIINHAHMFGLSDLHQMRGRVGRSNKKAFCYLLTQPLTGLTSDARKRLKTLEEFNDLGDGFKIAMKDLDIRGAGNLLGGEQSGFVTDIGFETYHKLLDETIQELKETQFKDLFSRELEIKGFNTDCNLETDLEILIPEEYVQNISERLRLYNDLDNLKDEKGLEELSHQIIDRFGPIPDEVKDLFQSVRLRWKAEKLGFQKLRLKGRLMKGYVAIEGNDRYFQSELFGKILKYVQTNHRKCSIKEHKNQMIISVKEVSQIDEALATLHQITA